MIMTSAEVAQVQQMRTCYNNYLEIFMSTCRHLVFVIQFVCVQKTLLSDVKLYTRPPPPTPSSSEL